MQNFRSPMMGANPFLSPQQSMAPQGMSQPPSSQMMGMMPGDMPTGRDRNRSPWQMMAGLGGIGLGAATDTPELAMLGMLPMLMGQQKNGMQGGAFGALANLFR